MSKRTNVKRYNRHAKASDALSKALRSGQGVKRATKKAQHALALFIGLKGNRARSWPPG